jgi:hypothetical protein
VTNVNEAPNDIDLSPRTIAENAGVNARVGAFNTVDPDNGNSFIYTLVTGVGDVDNAAFNINGANLLATNNFDFQTKSSYTVRVRTTDQGGLFTEKPFTVTVTNVNGAPTDIDLTSKTIAENAGSLASVGVLSTTDPDAGDTFTYTFVVGIGDTDNTAFSISGATLRATNSFNFETKPQYTVRIRSTDPSGLFTEKALTISVTDVNETPIDIDLSSSTVAENAETNAIVGTLRTIDQDAGDTFNYALVAGTGSADNAGFSIMGDQLRTNATFDFENRRLYSIRVRSTDSRGLSTEKAFAVHVTDINEAPTDIDLSRNTIEENASANTTVGTLTTTDTDDGSSFVYSLVAGTGDTDNAAFDIIGATLRATERFDFESKSTYTIRIRSSDQGGLFTEKIFTILVENVNEILHQNPANPYDVDNDGSVTPLDVLVVVNLLNSRGPSIPVTQISSSPPFVNVNGDLHADPLDVLTLVNFINARSGSGNGEGESPLGFGNLSMVVRDDTTSDRTAGAMQYLIKPAVTERSRLHVPRLKRSLPTSIMAGTIGLQSIPHCDTQEIETLERIKNLDNYFILLGSEQFGRFLRHIAS